MEINIKPDFELTVEDSLNLQHLSELLKSRGKLKVKEEKQKIIDEKSEEILIAIGLANLAFSGIKILIDCINTWQNMKKKYKITYILDGVTFEESNLSYEEFQARFKEIEGKKDLQVLITKK